MIDLYTWPTPNGFKVSIMLEELGLPYNVIPIDIGEGDQFQPEFLKISPNNKMPAIVDPDGPGGKPYSLFESGAILLYLGEKTGRFLPADRAERHLVVQWLMFQMASIGPSISGKLTPLASTLQIERRSHPLCWIELPGVQSSCLVLFQWDKSFELI